MSLFGFLRRKEALIEKPDMGKSLENAGDASSGSGENQPFLQNCFVMRHGERLDTKDASWHETAERPYDPPLSDSGRNRAMRFGLTMKREQWNVTRIVCSPFLRCVQTAAEVVKGLCSDDAGEGKSCSSQIKVCIECGIGEVMNSKILHVCPKFPVSALDMSVLFDFFPAQMRDYSFDPFLRKLTSMEESTEDAHARCVKAINHAANCFPWENILFVTHGDAVAAAAMEIGELYVCGVDFCGYLHGRRLIYSSPPEPLVSEKWNLLLDDDKYGLSWI